MYNRLISVDWLEIHAIESPDCDFEELLRANRYTYQIEPFSTRVYSQVINVLTETGVPLFHVTRCPFSVKGTTGGILPRGSMHVKLQNWLLYTDVFLDALYKFVFTMHLTLKNVTRLDLCCDLQRFADGTKPSTLLKKYLANEVHKIGQAKFQLFGTDKGTKQYHSIKWGSSSSAVHSRMYDKTKELREVKDKSYIRDSWATVGFDPEVPVWRIEFEIHADGRNMVQKETGEIEELNLAKIASPDLIEREFLKYARHYFDFRVKEEGVRKDRCKRKNLFSIGDEIEICKPLSRYPADPSVVAKTAVHTYAGQVVLVSDVTSSRRDRIALKYLADELGGNGYYSASERQDLKAAFRAISIHHRLYDWLRDNNESVWLNSVYKTPKRSAEDDGKLEEIIELQEETFK